MNSHAKFLSNKVKVACCLHFSRKILKRDRNCHLCIIKRVSMGLTVSREPAKNLAVRRKNDRILTVSRKKNVNRKKI